MEGIVGGNERQRPRASTIAHSRALWCLKKYSILKRCQKKVGAPETPADCPPNHATTDVVLEVSLSLEDLVPSHTKEEVGAYDR